MPQHEHDPYAPFTEPSSPFAEYGRTVRLDAMRFEYRMPLGAGVLDSIRTRVDMGDQVMRHAIISVAGSLLAEQLPPVTLDDQQAFTVPRYATWWDHYKATHWDRGRMWWLRELGWVKPPRTVDEPHTHVTTVDVRGRWTYPRATTVAPGRDFGHVVYKSDTSFRDAGVRPW